MTSHTLNTFWIILTVIQTSVTLCCIVKYERIYWPSKRNGPIFSTWQGIGKDPFRVQDIIMHFSVTLARLSFPYHSERIKDDHLLEFWCNIKECHKGVVNSSSLFLPNLSMWPFFPDAFPPRQCNTTGEMQTQMWGYCSFILIFNTEVKLMPIFSTSLSTLENIIVLHKMTSYVTM